MMWSILLIMVNQIEVNGLALFLLMLWEFINTLKPMTVLNKAKWILGILLVFGLIATTNLIDRTNFNRLRESVVSIYEDRLIAKDIILDLYKRVQEVEIALITTDLEFYKSRNDAINQEIQELFVRFERTHLSEAERNAFERLKGHFNDVLSIEETLSEKTFIGSASLLEKIKEMEADLYTLSDIQVSEGRRQMVESERANASIDFFTQIEMGVLILLAIMVQVIILYKPKEES